MPRALKRLSDSTARRRGADTGRLLLRLATGGLLFGHATQKLFGWFGQSRRQAEAGFGELGYRPAAFFVRLAGLAELSASLSLAAGAATPLGSVLTAATSAQAIQSAKWHNGLWEQDGGCEYLLLLGACGVTLAFVGAGRYSADGHLGTDVSGFPAGLAAVVAATVSLALPHRLPTWHDNDADVNPTRESDSDSSASALTNGSSQTTQTEVVE